MILLVRRKPSEHSQVAKTYPSTHEKREREAYVLLSEIIFESSISEDQLRAFINLHSLFFEIESIL